MPIKQQEQRPSLQRMSAEEKDSFMFPPNQAPPARRNTVMPANMTSNPELHANYLPERRKTFMMNQA